MSAALPWHRRVSLDTKMVPAAVLAGIGTSLAIAYLPTRLFAALVLGVGLVSLALSRPRLVMFYVLPTAAFVPPLVAITLPGLPSITPGRAAIGVAAVAALRYGHKSGRLPRWFKVAWLTLSIYLTLRFLADPSLRGLGRLTVYTAELLVAVWLGHRICRDAVDVTRLGRRLVALGGLAAVLMLYEFTFRRPLIAADNITFFRSLPRAGFFRAQGPFQHQIVAGAVMMILLLLLVGLWFQPRSRRALLGLAGAFIASGLLMALSRGPWLGLVIGMFVLILLIRLNRAVGLAVFGLLFGLAVLASPLGGTAADFLNAVIDPEGYRGQGGNEVTYRARLFEASLTYMNEHPWGSGLGHSDRLYLPGNIGPHRIDFARSIDNGYLNILLEIGWVGLGLFVVLLFISLCVTFRNYLRLRDDPALGPLAASFVAIQAAVMFVSVTVATFGTWGQLDLLFWMLTGVALSLPRLASRLA